MVTTITICSVVIYVLTMFVTLMVATYFELPRWAEYIICVVCFPLVCVWYLGYLINCKRYCYDDDDSGEDDED